LQGTLLELAATAAAQAVVVLWSGSVALLGDTLHNTADALTTVPLGVVSPPPGPITADGRPHRGASTRRQTRTSRCR